jgi:hypothetical protein
MLDAAQFTELLKEAERAFQPFVAGDGAITFAMPALIITARKA